MPPRSAGWWSRSARARRGAEPVFDEQADVVLAGRVTRQRAPDPFGLPIPGLSVAGELGSIRGFLHLPGGNPSECPISGGIAGREAAGAHKEES